MERRLSMNAVHALSCVSVLEDSHSTRQYADESQHIPELQLSFSVFGTKPSRFSKLTPAISVNMPTVPFLPPNPSPYRFPFNCEIILSISPTAPAPALPLSISSPFISLALRSSSPAFTTIPHFTNISLLSCAVNAVHFATNTAASFVFPAPRISL